MRLRFATPSGTPAEGARDLDCACHFAPARYDIGTTYYCPQRSQHLDPPWPTDSPQPTVRQFPLLGWNIVQGAFVP